MSKRKIIKFVAVFSLVTAPFVALVFPEEIRASFLLSVIVISSAQLVIR